MSGFLLDTNVVSELVRPRPDPQVAAWIQATPEGLLHLSVLTLGEIQKGVTLVASSARRAALQAWLDADLPVRFSGRILPVDASIAARWGALSGLAQARGIPLPVIDGLLAATALQHHLTLVTRSVRDLAPTRVPVLNPWKT